MTPAFVQGASNFSSSSASSIAEAYTSSVTAGNMLIACCGWASANTGGSITDTLGNTWTQQETVAGTSIGYGLTIWTAVAKSTGANTVTVTPPSAPQSFMRMAIHEYSGVDTLDQKITGQSNVGKPSIAMTTTQAVEVVFAFLVSNAGAATVSSPFTVRETPGSELTCDTITS